MVAPGERHPAKATKFGGVIEQSAEELAILSHFEAVLSASESFLDFVRFMMPDITLADFQLDLIDKLDRLEKGTLFSDSGQQIRRLMINMPPRHGKSFLATTLFPVYYMGKKPQREIMSVSYNADLAKTFGRSVRDNARDPVVHQVFPDFDPSDESRAVDMWKTTSGGVYYGVGMGGTTTGRGANLLIVDDPVKNRNEAESTAARNTNWNFYVSALVNRKQPERDGTPPIEIIILTRWHPDDLAGRLMETNEWKNGEWMHVVYPAIKKVKGEPVMRCDLPPDHPMYRDKEWLRNTSYENRYYSPETEVALWPERFPIAELHKLKALNEREFASLYQQTPYVQGGNLIKSTWFRRYDQPLDRYNAIILCADTAFKANTQSDYSVIMAGGLTPEGDIHILDVARNKWEFPQLKRVLVGHNLKWRGKGLRGIYVEDKASGQSLIQEMRSNSGMSVIPWSAKGYGTDKVARANAVTPLIEGGRVYLPNNAVWLETFIEEVQTFPASKHDDQVDALTMLIDVLSRQAMDNIELLNAPIEPGASLNTLMTKNPNSWKSALQSNEMKGWGEL